MKTIWKMDVLQDLISFYGKGIVPQYVDQKNCDAIWVLNQKCNTNHKISYDKARYTDIKHKPVSQERYLRIGDIIINATGYGTAGRVAQVDNLIGDTTVDSHMIIIRANYNKVHPKYLSYYMKYNQATIESYAEGSTGQTEISKNRLCYEFKVRYPDLETQKKIAKVLSALDDKIELNNQINKNLEEQANRIVKEYCQSVSSNVRLSKILSFVNGFAFQSKSYVANGRYRVITIKNVKDGEIDSNGAPFVDCLPISMKQECILGIGDVLVSLTGNVGRVGIVYESDLLLNQRVAKIVPYDMNLLPFLYFYFRMESTKISLETIAKGTAQQNLSTIETLKSELPYNDSIKEMSKRLKFLFETIVTNQRQNKVLSELRETLLPKLMSGEIDVDNVEI